MKRVLRLSVFAQEEQFFCWNTYPMKRVLRLDINLNPRLIRMLEHLPYEEGIKTSLRIVWFSRYCWNTYPMKRVLRP